MPREDTRKRTDVNVPKAHCLIESSSRKSSAVGAERHRAYKALAPPVFEAPQARP